MLVLRHEPTLIAEVAKDVEDVDQLKAGTSEVTPNVDERDHASSQVNLRLVAVREDDRVRVEVQALESERTSDEFNWESSVVGLEAVHARVSGVHWVPAPADKFRPD